MIYKKKSSTISNQQQRLNQSLVHNKVLVDGKSVVPVSLSPYILSEKKYKNLAKLCRHVYSAIEKILRIYIENQEVQAMFPELENYRALSCLAPEYNHWIHFCRFDIVETPQEEFKILETNCDCPGGILFVPKIKRIFKELQLLDSNYYAKEVQQDMDSEEFFVKSLIDLSKQHQRKIPNIVFLSSDYHPITSDMNLLEDIGVKMGLNCVHEKIQNLKLVKNVLSTKDFSIDLTYQKFDAFIDESGQAKPCIYDQSPDEVHAYWQALQDKNVLTVNSFPSSLVAENKRVLALLKNKLFEKYFTKDEKKAITELCPKTYSLTKSSQDDDLVKLITENKNQYVIKRTIDTRGRGVWVGKQTPDQEWRHLVRSSISEPYIIQEYIEHPQDKVLSAYDSGSFVEMYSNLAVFMIKGEPIGLFSRASENVVTNVGQKGCLRAVYILKNQGEKNDCKSKKRNS